MRIWFTSGSLLITVGVRGYENSCAIRARNSNTAVTVLRMSRSEINQLQNCLGAP
jgi:hypothetical protein